VVGAHFLGGGVGVEHGLQQPQNVLFIVQGALGFVACIISYYYDERDGGTLLDVSGIDGSIECSIVFNPRQGSRILSGDCRLFPEGETRRGAEGG
jgi:hypothetical protein